MSKDTIHLFNNVSVKGIIANGSIGTTGQTLASNGTVAYWSDITGYAGSVGFTGSRGTDGYAGSVGFTGSQGPQGVQGVWGGTANADVNMNNYSITNANNIGAVNVTVSGNLTVSGAVTTVNTTNLDVFDAIIRLNRGQATPLNDIGILMQRFAAANAASYNVGFAWEEGTDRLIFGTTPEDGSDNDLSFASEWMTIAANGNVGIGTATPAAFLHVNSTGPQARWDVSSATDARHEYYRNGLREGYISWDANLMSLAATQASGVITFASGGTTERMRIAANGNIGIGNTAPGSRLTILANGSNSFQFTKPDGTNLVRALWDGSNFHHYFDGNVYYNLANNNFTFSGGGSTGANFLSIINGARISVNDQPTGAVSGLVFAGSGSYANSTTTLTRITPVGIRTWAWNGTDGFTTSSLTYITQRQLSTANNDAVLTFNTSFNTNSNDIVRMYTANSNVEIVAGNLGIGTPSPVTKLHISGGSARIEHASDRVIDFIRASSNTFSIEHDTARMYFYNVSTANSVMAFTNASDVGIGTGNPAAKLHVIGGQSIIQNDAAAYSLWKDGTPTKAWQYALVGGTNHSFFRHYDGTAWNEIIRIQDTGNVGIGTNNPGTKLDVQSSTNTDVRFYSTTASSKTRVFIRSDTTNMSYETDNSNSSHYLFDNTGGVVANRYIIGANSNWQFFTAGTERVRISNTGNFGIGNTNPASKLVVAGNVEISTGGLNSVNGAVVISNTSSGSGTFTISTANSSANGGVSSEYLTARIYGNVDTSLVSGQRLYFQSAGANWSRGVTYTTTSPFTTVSGAGQHFGISTVDARSNATSSGVFSDLDVSHVANTAAGASATLQYSVITSSTTESSWSGTANNAMLYSGYNAGTLRYRVNRNGDIWTNGSITVTSTLATGNTTITGDLSVTGNTTLGDAAADNITINANTITIAANSNIDAGLLYIDSVNNRVGIGTTAPQNLLHLESTSPVIRFRDTDSAAGTYSTISSDNTTGSFLISADSANTAASSTISFLTDGAERVRFTGTGSALFLGSASQTLDIGTTTGVSYIQSYGASLANTPLAFYTGITERMRIASDGNVGIGTTNPAVKFVISNAGAEGYEINPTGGVGGGATVSAYNRSTSGYTTLTTYASAMTWYANGSTRAIDLASNGNVGINTSAPSSKFDVVGGDGDGIVYRTSTRSIGIGQLSGDPTLYWGSGTPLRFFSGSELARISNTGNVGIGTNNPLVKLHLFDSNAPETRLQIGNTLSEGAYTFYSGSTKEAAIGFIPNSSFLNISSGRSAAWGGTITFTTDTSERMRIASNGNVGIGNSAPGALLHVNGDTRLASNTTGGNWISFQRTGTNAWKMGSDGVGDVFTVVGNLVTFEQNVTIRRQGLTVTPTTETLQAVDISQTWNNAAATFAALKLNITDTASNANSLLMNLQTGGVSQFIVRKDGNVGIGTSNPARKLTVQGDSAGTLTVAAFYNADLTNNNGSVFSFRTDTSGAGAQSFWEYAGVSGVVNEHNNATRAGSLNFFTANSTGLANRLTIASDGNVGIANSTPTDRLSVNGTGYFSDNLSIVRTNTAGSLSGLTINNPGTSTAYSGINITSGTVTSQLFNDAAGNAVVAGAVLRTTSNHPFVFGTNNTEQMRIAANGNVGIGNTTPADKLSVTGAISVTGQVKSPSSTYYFDATNGLANFTNAYFANWYGSDSVLRIVATTGRTYFAPTAGNVAIANTSTAPNALFVTGDIGLDGISVRDTATATTTALTQITLFEYPIATYDSSDIIIKAVRAGERHTTKVLVTANSTVAIATEYGTLITGTSLYSVDADISGANTRIRITPSSTTSTVFKASYELITT